MKATQKKLSLTSGVRFGFPAHFDTQHVDDVARFEDFLLDHLFVDLDWKFGAHVAHFYML